MADSASGGEGPYVPADKHIPEITPLAVILGILLSVVLAGANAYLGLFAGLTVSASIPAAVISMALLRGLGGNILQNNAVQTAASAGESLAAGVIFTLPALVLLGVWSGFNYIETTILAGFGGLLGVLFTIPLRRALIVEQPLQFPEGVATAEVLKVGETGGAGVRYIAIGGAVGALFKLLVAGFNLSASAAHAAFYGGKSAFRLGTDLSPALLAVGYIVGLNIAVLVFLGGAVNFLVAIPIFTALNPVSLLSEVPAYAALHLDPSIDAGSLSNAVWGSYTRYLGVGAMLVGGIWALIRLSPSLARGIKSSLAAYKDARGEGDAVPRTEQDLPMQLVFILGGVSVVPLFFIFEHFTHEVALSAFMAVFMLIAGFLFSAVAAYMAGLVGSSNNPISGVTIATILTAALLLKLLGTSSALGPAAAIFIGAVVCSAAAIGGDNMQDLKAGHVVGSTPKKQQVMQALGVVAAAFVMAPVLNILNDAYTIGSKSLSAPQSSLMMAVADGVFGGGLPWDLVLVGAGIAVVVIVIDLILEARGSSFRTPVLAFAVGIYLPFELSVPIFIGGLLAHLATRAHARGGSTKAESRAGAQNGMLLAAGLITGEALLGILLAVPIAVSQHKDVLYLMDSVVPPFSAGPSSLPGLLLFGAVMYLVYWAATRRKS